MKIIRIEQNDCMSEALAILSNGGLVIFPTETAYGVAVDATNVLAVSRLLAYKQRPAGKPISIGVCSLAMAEKYVELNDVARSLYAKYLPGPVTVISVSRGLVDSRLESAEGTIGIRMPDHPFVLELISRFGKPVTTTSANSAGEKTPYTIQDVFDNLSPEQKDMLGLVIDAGKLAGNATSTVVDSTKSPMFVYRQGQLDPPGSYFSNSNAP